MENRIINLKFVLTGVSMVFMLCLAAVLAMVAPAMAQDGGPDNGAAADVQYGDNINVGGDINSQVCQNIIGDISVNADQYNSGDQIAIGDGNVQAIAQEQNVTVNVVQNCINQINSSLNGDGGSTTPDDTTTPDDDATPDDEQNVQINGEEIVMSSTMPKTLANTGGTASPPGSPSSAASRAATLLPAGALLMAFGAMTFCVRSWRR